MEDQAPDSEAISKWLTTIFKAPANNRRVKIKDIAPLFGQRFNRLSPTTLISKALKGERDIKVEELAFFEELFGEAFPPPWALRHAPSKTPEAVYQSLAESQAAWDSGPAPQMRKAQPRTQDGLYMVPVAGSEAAPAYRPGNTIWVDPWRPAKATDDVYIELIDRNTRNKIKVGIIRECVEVHPDYFVFALWAPGTEERHDRCNLAAVHPIASVDRSQN